MPWHHSQAKVTPPPPPKKNNKNGKPCLVCPYCVVPLQSSLNACFFFFIWDFGVILDSHLPFALLTLVNVILGLSAMERDNVKSTCFFLASGLWRGLPPSVLCDTDERGYLFLISNNDDNNNVFDWKKTQVVSVVCFAVKIWVYKCVPLHFEV